MTQADYDRLNPPWPIEVVEDEETGKPYVEYIDNSQWLYMGHVPRPKTRLGWFFHDLAHGLMMRYPPFPVILYAVRGLFPVVFVEKDAQ